MNSKKIKTFIGVAFAVALAFTACKDKFNEEDFLNKQYSLDTARTNKQVAALNSAGKLLSFTVQVIEDKNPLAGVIVKISNTTGSTALTAVDTTDANGNAIFENVQIGGNTISLSKTGYVTASAVVDFGTITNPTNWTTDTKGNVIPVKLTKSLRLPLFSNSATATASTAVIKGKVTIESDLTNTAPEIPAPIQIKANFAATIGTTAAGGNAVGSGVTLTSYIFTEGSLGTSTTDASGNYSITVPAFSDGLDVTLDVPTIDGTQKVAVTQLNGVNIATGPEYRQVPTTWGPSITPDNIPNVPGATAVFPAPPAAGRGFGITFAAVGRTLDGTSITTDVTNATNTTYTITNRGSNFTASPTVTITAGGGANATAVASLRGYVTGMNVTNGGTGYPVSTPVRIHFQYTNASGTPVNFGTDVFATVTTTAGGALPTGPVTLPNQAGFIGNTQFTTDFAIQGFTTKITDAANGAITPTTAAAVTTNNINELDAVAFTNVGSGFTSAPTITLSGGGATTQAAVSVTSFRTQFDLTLGGAATTPYKILPKDINFYWPGTASDQAVTEQASTIRLSPVGVVVTGANPLISFLTTDGTNVVAIQPNNKLRTARFWSSAPIVDVVDAAIAQAKSPVAIGSDGKILGFSDGTSIAGIQTTVSVSNTATLQSDPGKGYDTRFPVTIQPTITGAPGSGAVIELTQTSNNVTRLVTWDGTYTLQSAGSGYLQNLNQVLPLTGIAFSGTTSLTVKVGNVYVVDIKYGTGLKREAVK